MMNSQRGYATIAVVSLVAAIQVWLEAYLGHVIPIGWYTGPAMFTSCVLHILQIVGLVGGIMWTAIPGDSTFGERFDVKCKWQVEIDDYATRVLEKHWPDVRRCRDICDFPPRGPDHWRVDCICGGFPCQDISYAGNGPVLRASVPACFTRRCESLANWDQESLSWKTSQLSLLEDYQTFSGRWPRSGLMRNGTAYQLPPLVPRISGTES